MAGISQKVTPDEVVPLLARNVFVLGYEGEWSKGRPSEFLVLLNRYVQQARELVTSQVLLVSFMLPPAMTPNRC